MTCFYQNLLDKSFELIKSLDTYKDALSDLYQINNVLQNLQIQQPDEYLCRVRQLDLYMRQKYPMIQNIVDVATRMEQALPLAPTKQNHTAYSQQESLIFNLEQDHIGIRVDVGIKEGVGHEIKDFIEKVTREEKQRPQIFYPQHQ